MGIHDSTVDLLQAKRIGSNPTQRAAYMYTPRQRSSRSHGAGYLIYGCKTPPYLNDGDETQGAFGTQPAQSQFLYCVLPTQQRCLPPKEVQLRRCQICRCSTTYSRPTPELPDDVVAVFIVDVVVARCGSRAVDDRSNDASASEKKTSRIKRRRARAHLPLIQRANLYYGAGATVTSQARHN
jgi:hypothetical protein